MLTTSLLFVEHLGTCVKFDWFCGKTDFVFFYLGFGEDLNNFVIVLYNTTISVA